MESILLIPDPINHIIYSHQLSKSLYGLYQNLDNIKKYKRAIIYESEKSVLLMNSYYSNDSIAVSVGGSVFHEYQIELLKSVGVERVLICFDYETDEKILEKFEKSYKRSVLQFDTYIPSIESMKNLLNEKDSPIDKGKEVFEKINLIRYELNI